MATSFTRLSMLALAVMAFAAQADDKTLNIYSARHYQTDEALYANFTKLTGIKVNRLDGKEDELLERIKTEGAKSPADILITVDAARLEIADQAGLFAPIQSKVLDKRIPANLRTPNWIAFSTRARLIAYNKSAVKAEWVQTYGDLAHPRLKGQVCVRSGSHPYNLSLGGAFIAHQSEQQAEAWARGLVQNFARSPKGGDTDQLKAVAAGECGVTITNSYYLARLMRSNKPEDRKVVEALGVAWPNQQTWGTHINVSGAGIIKTAPNKAAAMQFLEYLSSDQAQAYFADGNNEWPAVASVKIDNPALTALGQFKPDTIGVGELAKNAAKAQKLFDRAGWR
ncbi:Fe(3+) ABC transporter substrate-binding protein [Aquabacterium sp.]|uniref:Fe(3+) ABC transporter substrate-binding protein n=1 Tax=Aquabacterium sp. TaxID=1872578 RepID=UPI0025C6AF05|nr:Fe(3+) ABC transporter substrate-binding protein [Aquabacterium sp.]